MYSATNYFGSCVTEKPPDVHIETEGGDISDVPRDDIENIIDSLKNVQDVLCGKAWEDLSEELRTALTSFAYFMGSLINQTVYADSSVVGGLFKDLQGLRDLTLHDFIAQRNGMVSAFYRGATGVDASHPNEGKLKALAHLHEQLLYTRNIRVVTPFAFQKNLIMYSTTGSKTCVTLNSQWESTGSYTTVSNIATMQKDPLACPNGDVINVFDNNQKVGKHSGRIREGSTVPQSVCTAVTHIVPQPDTLLQNDECLFAPVYLLIQRRNR